MAVRFGSGPVRLPGWAFTLAGFVLVVGLFFGVRGIASPDGGAQGGGSGGSHGGGTSAGAGGGDAGGASGSGGSGGGSSSGTSSGTSNGSWQTGGGDGEPGGNGNGNGNGSSGTGNTGSGTSPGWLPWGPRSPNTDEELEPDSAYDLLQQGECQEAYNAAIDPAKQTGNQASPDSWKVIEGLGGICKAAQGESDGLGIAAKAEKGLRASNYQPGSTDQLCKDGEAYAVLQRFVGYYRQHPDEKVVLRPSASGSEACENKITASDNSYAPGTSAYFYGTWPDQPETVELSAAELTDPVVVEPFGDKEDKARCCKDATISIDLPGPEGYGGRRPTVIDVTLVTEKGARVVQKSAFTLDWTGIDPPPSPDPPSPNPPSPNPPSPDPPSPGPSTPSPVSSSPEASGSGASIAAVPAPRAP
ncbi:hypothetical protein AB0B50_00805 [Streptomyces sp. NPDC041068]|uniref:hypothetical protein n=1 Tax=Streptomyces sp. NPDC041068 TaxID=3155130 RepID=UPI0033CD7775